MGCNDGLIRGSHIFGILDISWTVGLRAHSWLDIFDTSRLLSFDFQEIQSSPLSLSTHESID